MYLLLFTCFFVLTLMVMLRRPRMLPFVPFLVVFAVLLVQPAFADGLTIVNEHDVYTAILQPILMAIATAVGTIILAVAYRANTWLKQKTGIAVLEEDQAHRDTLSTSLNNAAGLVLNQLGNKLDGKTIDVRDPVVKLGIDYVMKTAPDALQHFGLQDQANAIAEKIVAKLPQIANTNGGQS